MNKLIVQSQSTTEDIEKETQSMMQAYAKAPWGEIQHYAEAKEFIDSIYDNPDAFTIVVKSNKLTSPYLYIHGVDYKHDINQMIQDEFVGDKAYWQVDLQDKENVVKKLKQYKSVVYVKNIHADKEVVIPKQQKPRLKLINILLERIFQDYKRDSIILFTNKATGVYSSLTYIDKNKYSISQFDYHAHCDVVKFNKNHSIDNLTLVIIKKIKQI